jgi:hypothetical protein
MKHFLSLAAMFLPLVWGGIELGVAQAQPASAAPTPSGAPLAVPTPTAVPSASAVPVTDLDPSSPPEVPASSGELTTLPLDLGLPLVVRVGVSFANVQEVDENDATFTGTIDLRAAWRDPRLAYEASTAPTGFIEVRGDAAEERLGKMWSPNLGLSNLEGEPSYQTRGLRIQPDGSVVLTQRTTGSFTTTFDVARFPFDQQRLEVSVESRDEANKRLTLDFRQPDLDFSQPAPGLSIDGFTPGLVELRREPTAGWNGAVHSRVWASLRVTRDPTGSIAPIFIPLFASLLIPFLSLWLNRVEDGELQVEAFELTNIIIGGLFALIALNFTVNAEYSTLASGENPVKWLFGLNYVALAIALVINVLLFRFQLAKRWFGKYVQEQLFLYLIWAVPLFVLGTAAAIVLSASV